MDTEDLDSRAKRREAVWMVLKQCGSVMDFRLTVSKTAVYERSIAFGTS